jgi:hypothetical protein
MLFWVRSIFEKIKIKRAWEKIPISQALSQI